MSASERVGGERERKERGGKGKKYGERKRRDYEPAAIADGLSIRVNGRPLCLI